MAISYWFTDGTFIVDIYFNKIFDLAEVSKIMIRKVIITAGGLGTRLYPATKEQPKEMLPIFSQSPDGKLIVKPIVQVVFEQLYSVGLKEFCYVVGRGKRSIEDHFTQDPVCVRNLADQGKNGQATELNLFYERLKSVRTMWVNQPEASGFGNAILMAQPFIQNEPCLVHAGDGLIISEGMDYLKKLISVYEQFNADCAFLVLEIDNPKQYGIVEGEEIEAGIIKVKKVTEKPKMPKTNLAIMAMYIFDPVIFKALEVTKPDSNSEIQLTDAIQKLIEWGLRVFAVKLDKNYSRLDIGSPEIYWEALNLSHQCCIDRT